jgi:GNAT superfamily N-acetyltransferase
MTDSRDLLALYDAEMRRDPVPDAGSRVERVGSVVRVVGSANYVLYSELTAEDARETIAAQAEYFRRVGSEVEWKRYGHDLPANLEELLAEAGFVPDAPETLVAYDLRDGLPGGTAPEEILVRRVTEEAGVRDAATVNAAAFGTNDPDAQGQFARVFADPNQALFVAYVEGIPVASGRLEQLPRRSFAGLWGGGTSPEYRHRGVYRSLVAARAAVARDSGYRYLTVDAQESSRPILERLGFVPLTTTRGWILRPDPVPGGGDGPAP